VIKVCNCLPCEMKQASAVVDGIKREIGIGPGQTTADGKFTLEIVGCIGACDQAPAMLINDKLYGNLTADGIGRDTEILLTGGCKWRKNVLYWPTAEPSIRRT